uniref:Uncharacterized protein n=1 Tax=Lotus japonicus TaxID=34305 RepID=I3SG69_LOTJA|nr:unknown [Lotus japonicus]
MEGNAWSRRNGEAGRERRMKGLGFKVKVKEREKVKQ